MRICIGEHDRNGEPERVLDGACTVVSRSGLSVGERLLIESLPRLTPRVGVLVLGNRTGVCAMLAAARWPECPVIFHGIDLYHMDRVRRNLARNGWAGAARDVPYAGAAAPSDVPSVEPVAGRRGVDTVCSAFLDPALRCDVVLIQATDGGLVGELLAEFLDVAHAALTVGGRLLLAVDTPAPWLRNQLKRLFGKYTVTVQSRDDVLIVATRDARPTEPRAHAAEVVMTMHAKEPVYLTTLPGVFAHRKVDDGAQALAEVAEACEGDRVLDIGCGSGVVGISLARNCPVAHTVFVDANARATHVTAANCRRNGIERHEVVLGAEGIDRPAAFTLTVGNPPYFSDYKIAELFIRTARSSLCAGGRAYLVAKTGVRLLALLQASFGNGECIKRRGYDVLRAIKER